MAAASSSEPWHGLFVGVSGAAAVLTGLLFVSLSINLPQIIGQASHPPTTADRGQRGRGAAGHPAGDRGRASLLARGGGGLYWLVPALILLLGVGVIYAWVLHIEILR